MAKLKSIWTDRKQAVTKGDVTKKPEPKPELRPDDKQKPPVGKPEKPEPDEDQDEKDNEPQQPPQAKNPVFKKKQPNPFVKKGEEQEPEEEDE